MAVCGLLFSAPARSLELITNGDFETGDLSGWVVNVQPGGAGSFFAGDNSVPLGGGLYATPFVQPSVGPASGNFYAVSDETGASAQALTQGFTVPSPGLSVFLTFELFVNDWSGAGPIVNPAGLDYTATPNQHARVDIIRPAAGPFDTGPAAVVANFYLGVDPGSSPHSYTTYNFNITPFVGGGGTFVLRFADVETEGFLNQGVDNVSITATTPGGGSAPEPASIFLVALGLAAIAFAARVRRHR